MSALLNPQAVSGHNAAPGMIAMAQETMADLGVFLANHPVIDTEAAAFAGAEQVKRVNGALAGMEDERKAKVNPLNEALSDINAQYRHASQPIQRTLDELRRRLTAFAEAEEMRREAEAQVARRAAEAAEQAAREAEAKEREAVANAGVGEVVDVAGAIAEADSRFANFKKADRQARVAERDVPVKLATGVGRALSLRSRETLVLVDATAALAALGVTEGIREAMLTAARSYRTLKGELPPGVTNQINRSI